MTRRESEKDESSTVLEVVTRVVGSQGQEEGKNHRQRYVVGSRTGSGGPWVKKQLVPAKRAHPSTMTTTTKTKDNTEDDNDERWETREPRRMTFETAG